MRLMLMSPMLLALVVQMTVKKRLREDTDLMQLFGAALRCLC